MVGLGIAPDVIPRVQRILYIFTNYDRTRKGIFTLPVGNQQKWDTFAGCQQTVTIGC